MSRRPQPGRHRTGPEITITDLGHRATGGSARQRPDPAPDPGHVRSTRAFLLLAVLAALLGAAAVLAAAPDRSAPHLQLDGSQAVYLVLSGGAPTLRLQVSFRLVDSGGPATVLGAAVSDSLLRGGQGPKAGPGDGQGPLAELRGHDAAQLPLEQPVRCRLLQPPVVPRPTARLVLRLRTAAGDRTVRLLLPNEPARSIALELTRRCGWMPVAEAVRLRAGAASLVHHSVLVPLSLSSISARPVRVTALASVSPDVEVKLVGALLPVQVSPASGPRPLAAGAAAHTRLLLAFRVSPAACAHGHRPAPTGVLLRVSADQGVGSASQTLHPDDATGALRRLHCP